MSAFPKDYFSPRKTFERQLREYCWDVANMRANEDTLLAEAKAIEKNSNIPFADALMEMAERHPDLTVERCLAIEPADVIYNLAEAAGGDLIKTVGLVRVKYPDLAELDELYRENPDLFEAACRRVGSLGGDHKATEGDVVAKILDWSERITEERENADWPHNERTGERMSMDEVIKAVL